MDSGLAPIARRRRALTRCWARPGMTAEGYVASPPSSRYVCSMPETHFGNRTVPLDEKQALVDDVFHKVARRYDLMNDLMSGGLHRAWKDALVTAINPPKGDGEFKLLDVAGGTGDVSFRTIEAGGYGTRATVADINAEMLAVGRGRAQDRGLDNVVTFVDANAEALPFPDKSFDAISIAFGIRNVPR